MPTKKLANRRTNSRRFRDRNRRFRKLTKNRQRIKIIKDVIAYLETGKFKATQGLYLRLKGYRNAVADDDQVHELVEKSKCEVCGIGGIFVAAVMLKNELKVSDLDSNPYSHNATAAKHIKVEGVDDGGMREYLATWFDGDQLSLIESAFEQDDGYAGGSIGTDAAEFGKTYKTPRARFLAICKNMLANGGQFVPEASSDKHGGDQ